MRGLMDIGDDSFAFLSSAGTRKRAAPDGGLGPGPKRQKVAVEWYEQMRIDREAEEEAKRRWENDIARISGSTFDPYDECISAEEYAQNEVSTDAYFDMFVEECTYYREQKALDAEIGSDAYLKAKYAKKVSGDTTLRLVNKTLDEFGYERTPEQMTFHNAMIVCTVYNIFGDEVELYFQRILRDLGADCLDDLLAIICPRRMGKTWSVAMYIAAISICLLSINVMVFAIVLEASRKMIALTEKFISSHSRGAKMIDGQNKDMLRLKVSYNNQSYINTVCARSGKVVNVSLSLSALAWAPLYPFPDRPRRIKAELTFPGYPERGPGNRAYPPLRLTLTDTHRTSEECRTCGTRARSRPRQVRRRPAASLRHEVSSSSEIRAGYLSRIVRTELPKSRTEMSPNIR